MEKLQVRWVRAECVPWFLADNQREYWITVASELLEKSTQEISFLGKIVTGDESWVFAYNPEPNNSHPNGTPHPPYDQRNLRLQSQTCKTCFCILWYCMHHTSWIYAWRDKCECGWLCWGAVTFTAQRAKKRLPEKWHNGWILHYYNAWSCMVMAVQQFLVEKPNAFILQPLHLPDLAPSDFLSFAILKMGFWNQLILTVEMQCHSQPAHHTQGFSKSACKHGKTNRERACLQKRCTLRAFRQESTAFQIFKFYRWIPGTFWYCHVHKLTVHWT